MSRTMKRSAAMPKATIHMTVLTAAAMLTGCYAPGGGLMPKTGGPQTFPSSEMLQETVTLYDTRTNEVISVFEIPPGKQLVLDFDEGEGDDPVHTPDLLRWDIMDRSQTSGKLHRAQTVPNAASRRLEVTLHQGPAYTAQSPEQALRTDQIHDRPDWWTSKGGPLPDDVRTGMYDN